MPPQPPGSEGLLSCGWAAADSIFFFFSSRRDPSRSQHIFATELPPGGGTEAERRRDPADGKEEEEEDGGEGRKGYRFLCPAGRGRSFWEGEGEDFPLGCGRPSKWVRSEGPRRSQRRKRKRNLITSPHQVQLAPKSGDSGELETLTLFDATLLHLSFLYIVNKPPPKTNPHTFVFSMGGVLQLPQLLRAIRGGEWTLWIRCEKNPLSWPCI